MRTKVDIGSISRADLKDNKRLGELYCQAVGRGWWDNTETAVLSFYCLAKKALRDDREGTPGRLFYALLKEKDTSGISNKLEDQVLKDLSAERRRELVVKAGADGKAASQADGGGVEIAKHDRVHCLMPGLFRSIKKGERQKEKLDIRYQIGDRTVRVLAMEPLGADDMRILQGMIAVGSSAHELVDDQTPAGMGEQLWLDLRVEKRRLHNEQGMLIQTTYKELKRVVGLSQGASNHRIKSSLFRLGLVAIFVQDGLRTRMFHLLSQSQTDDRSKTLWFVLNPLITDAFFGQHTRIVMSEVRSLNSDAARLIHQRLCGWIDPGSSGRVVLDTLCEYVYPKECSDSALRRRRTRVRRALPELASLGWSVLPKDEQSYQISRPK